MSYHELNYAFGDVHDTIFISGRSLDQPNSAFFHAVTYLSGIFIQFDYFLEKFPQSKKEATIHEELLMNLVVEIRQKYLSTRQ